MLYLTSDHHFFHANSIRMSGRPFADVGEMNAALIANWNAVVSKDDEVYILGDFAYKCSGKQASDTLKKLKGRKYLIRGNHEKYLTYSDFDPSAYEWVKDYHVLDYKDARFILFHYPILEWAHYHRKSAHCHGHLHKDVSYIPEDSVQLPAFSQMPLPNASSSSFFRKP
jgi:calcineurin-like phosphoesterase family protein